MGDLGLFLWECTGEDLPGCQSSSQSLEIFLSSAPNRFYITQLILFFAHQLASLADIKYSLPISGSSLQNYQMKKTSPIIDIQPSFTENVRQSPEQELKYISSNLSFEGTPQKVMALSARRQPFTLNGWENIRQKSSKTLLKTTRAKQFSLACSTPSSTISRLLRPNPKCDNFRTLQPKQRKHMIDLNFKCGERHGSMRGSTVNGSRPQQDSTRFRQRLNKQKVGLLQFYQNQRVKRRLMMIEMAEPQSSITIIQYPLEVSSPRPVKTARKISAYRRYFN